MFKIISTKKILKIVLILSLLALIVYSFVGYLYYKMTLSEIENGAIIHTKELGWISKKHALPDGPKAFLERYKDTIFNENDTITYSQIQGIPLFNQKYYFKIEKKFKIKSQISNLEKDRVLFYIFKQVTNEFEQFQAKIPFYVVDAPYSSCFAKGDLTGNLIAYYCAYKGLKRDSVLNKLQITPFNDSLKADFKNDKRQKNWLKSNQKMGIMIFFNELSCFDAQESLEEIASTTTFQFQKE